MQDLSGQLPPNPVTPSSMMAVNTTTQDGTGFTGPGSDNELVKAGDAGRIPSLGDIAVAKPRSVLTHGTTYAPTSVTWKDTPNG